MIANLSIDRLLEVARSPKQEDRSALADWINDLCLKSGRTLTGTEKALVYDIFRALISEVEAHVRKNLSIQLAGRDDAPRDLIQALATDEIEVAYPVLVHSPILQDSDLIDLILTTAEQHHLAISKRERLSEKVSEKLVETESPKVIESLLANEGASIGRPALKTVVELSRSEPVIREPLARRKELDLELATAMFEWVGTALREEIKERFDISDSTIDKAVDQAISDALDDDDFLNTPPPKPHITLSGVATYGPHPKALLKALEQGDVVHFEELFKEITNLSSGSVTRVLYDAGPEALAIASKGSHIPASIFSEILIHMHGGGDREKYPQSVQYKKTMDYFGRIDESGSARVLQAWRDAPSESWG